MPVMSWKARVYRRVRRHPVVEAAQIQLRKSPRLNMPFAGCAFDIPKGAVIVDGGANVGDISSLFARTGARVHAFEPNPRTFAALRRRFSLTPRVTCHNAGLTDRACTLRLVTPKPDARFDAGQVSVSSTLSNRYQDADAAQFDVDEVPCRDIAAVIDGIDRPIALLKLDIEGAEIPVVARLLDTGAIARVQHVLVETHERFSPELAAQTEAMRARVAAEGLSDKFFFDWG